SAGHGWTCRISEQDFDPELHLPRCVDGPRHLSGGGERRLVLCRAGEHWPRRRGEVSAIEYVEHLEPELQPRVTLQRLVLHERYVDVRETGAAKEVTWRVADGPLQRQLERAGVEPAVRVARDDLLRIRAGLHVGPILSVVRNVAGARPVRRLDRRRERI